MSNFILYMNHVFSNTLKYRNALMKNVDGWKAIFDSQVKPANLKEKKLRLLGRSLYIEKLNQVLEDSVITPDEKTELSEIAAYFNLDAKIISEMKAKMAAKAVEVLVTRRYDDKVLTDAEKTEIVGFAKFLGLKNTEVERIRLKVASSLFHAALNDKLSDKRLTPAEETELVKLLGDLQIDSEAQRTLITANTLKDLAFAKLLWQLENGIFTVISNVQVNLKKNEDCYLSFTSNLLEQKIVTTGYTTSRSGVSIRIAKGVRYRVGSARSKAIKEQVTIKHPGVIYLTNERIVFASTGKKSFSVKFEKLVTFEVYSDGINFVMEGKNYLMQMTGQSNELFAVGLSSAIRNFLDGNNGTRQQAQDEINRNDSFINIM